jgi:hypothetical protein
MSLASREKLVGDYLLERDCNRDLKAASSLILRGSSRGEVEDVAEVT